MIFLPYLHWWKTIQVHESIQENVSQFENGKLFGYVQYNSDLPDNLGNHSHFSSIFKNTSASKNDLGDLIETFPEEEGKKYFHQWTWHEFYHIYHHFHEQRKASKIYLQFRSSIHCVPKQLQCVFMFKFVEIVSSNFF